MARAKSSLENFVRDVVGNEPSGVSSVKLELKDRENIGRFYTVVCTANSDILD